MNQPKGFQYYPYLVCMLKKSLCGLKQTPRASYAKMDNFLLSLGFERWKYDPNVYLHHVGDVLQVIVVYVGDILIIGSCIKEIGSIKASLHNEFSMIDVRLLKQFLGLEIEKSERWIKFIQQNYDSNLLFNFNMFECKASKFPFLTGIKLGEVGDSPLVDSSLYRHLVGSLLYLKNYRHDLAYSIGVVDRYMQ